MSGVSPQRNPSLIDRIATAALATGASGYKTPAPMSVPIPDRPPRGRLRVVAPAKINYRRSDPRDPHHLRRCAFCRRAKEQGDERPVTAIHADFERLRHEHGLLDAISAAARMAEQRTEREATA